MTRIFCIFLLCSALLAPAFAAADDLEDALRQLHPQYQAQPVASVSQSGGMTLEQAIESVRRRGDVERIVSAETKREGNREVHYIKYLTKGGTVKTAKIPGRSRG